MVRAAGGSVRAHLAALLAASPRFREEYEKLEPRYAALRKRIAAGRRSRRALRARPRPPYAGRKATLDGPELLWLRRR